MTTTQDVLFESDEFTEDQINTSGYIDQPGWYHLEVAQVDPELAIQDADGNEKTPVIRMKMTVMHEAPGQSGVGKMMYHDIYVGKKGGGPPVEGSKKSAIRFLTGIGVMKWVDSDGKRIPVDAETGAKQVTVDLFKKCTGRHLIAKLEREADSVYNGKPVKGRLKISYGAVYQIGDPTVEKVPYNKDVYERAMATANGGFGAAPKVEAENDGF